MPYLPRVSQYAMAKCYEATVLLDAQQRFVSGQQPADALLHQAVRNIEARLVSALCRRLLLRGVTATAVLGAGSRWWPQARCIAFVDYGLSTCRVLPP